MENKSSHIAATVGVVAILIGGFFGYMVGNNGSDSATSQVPSSQTKAADVRVALNNALREHVNIAGVALRNVFTGSPDTDAAVAALDENSKEVAGLVGSVYGDEAETQFLDLWRQHINFFANYTVAAKNDDKAGMDNALEDLAGYGEAASTFFEQANPNLPKSAVKPLLGEHRDLVIQTINLIGAGDFDAAYLKLGEAADQVGTIGDALANGIVTQNPDSFQE